MLRKYGLKFPVGNFLLSFIILTNLAYASDIDYWACIKRVASKRFRHNFKVSLTVGYEQRAYFERVHRGNYGDLTLTVPIYSSRDRRALEKEKEAFLEHWAAIIKDYEASKEKLAILRQQAKAAKAVMGDGGISAINAYFDIIKEITKTRAEVRQYRRMLDAVCREGKGDGKGH